MYWLGFHLRKYVPAFASLSIPHAEKIPKYYNLALTMFHVFELKVPEFMFRQTVTTKFIYYHLLDNRKQPPRILRVYPTIEFKRAWKWIQCSFVDPKYRDLAWRVLNAILPTQTIYINYTFPERQSVICVGAVRKLYLIYSLHALC